jgi:cyclic-di-AMP phosphodiesterase PgpH
MFSAIKKFIDQRRSKFQMGKKGLTGSRKRRTQDDSLAAAADKSKPLNIAILSILWVLCSLVLCLPLDKTTESLLITGQQAPETIFAKFDFDYQDKELTELKRQEAAAKVPLFFRLNIKIEQDCKARTEQFFAAINKRIIALQSKQKYLPPADSKIAKLVANMDDNTLQDFYYMMQDDNRKRNFIENMELALNRGIMDNHSKQAYKVGQMIKIVDSKGRSRREKQVIDVQTPQLAAKQVAEKALAFYSSSNKKLFTKIMTEVVEALLAEQGNLRFDEKTTRIRREAVASATLPYVEAIKKDQRIINKNEIVTEKLLSKLNKYNRLVAERVSSAAILRHKLELISWCLVLMLVTGLYLYNVNPDIIKSNQKVLLTASTIIISLIINYAAIEVFSFFSTQFSLLPVLVLDAMPLALPAIVLAVTTGLRGAIYIGFFVSILTAMMMNNSYDIVLEGLVISCFAGLAVRNATNYRSFFIRAAGVAFITATLLNFNFFIETLNISGNIVPSLSIIAITSIMTAILGLVIIFIFELLFNISTNMSLLMLCDYNHPLLRRLQLEAPGTFHHSLTVSTLAEYAAGSIGANPIKARVGALFHDIGKLVKPEYFTENSLSPDGKHTDLHPRMSSLIILNHVKDGVDLAMKYKLRKIIRDAIEQHHGTDIVYYFYQKALKENREKDLVVSEQEYRYPGPLPKEKEVAIICLADACEAASRSLQKPTPTKIEALIWEIFRKRIRDGQLDDADLTFAELSQIKKSFVKTLTMMNHGRIAYPKDEDNDESDLFMAAQKTTAPKSAVAEKNDKKSD